MRRRGPEQDQQSCSSEAGNEETPAPPKRTNQTSQRLKRLSKMIKQTIPAKLASSSSAAKSSINKVASQATKKASPKSSTKTPKMSTEEVKSEPPTKETDILKEKRAVSESRFKLMEKETKEEEVILSSPPPSIGATISSLREKFETSPVRDVMLTPRPTTTLPDKVAQPPRIAKPSVLKKVKKGDETETTTSPESSVDDKAKRRGQKSRKSSGKSTAKPSRKRVSHSGCEACHSDREHREHRKEKRRQKREKDKLSRQQQPKKPAIPPPPLNYQVSNKPGFFSKLLIDDNLTKAVQERASRPRKAKVPPRSRQPTINVYLNQKKIVTESRFRKQDDGLKLCGRSQPSLAPGPTFHRSISNLEKRNLESKTTLAQSPDRPQSEMSQRSQDRPYSSLPRPESSLTDHEEYKNYVLEVLHSTTKNARFQQLRTYYNILDRALKLEKKSSSMDIHKLRSEQVVDFETWRILRQKEKAKEELSVLMNNLDRAQKERQFHYCPKKAESVRWRGDIRLRNRDKSVENIKNQFSTMSFTKPSSNIKATDTYKLNWRPKNPGKFEARGGGVTSGSGIAQKHWDDEVGC